MLAGAILESSILGPSHLECKALIAPDGPSSLHLGLCQLNLGSYNMTDNQGPDSQLCVGCVDRKPVSPLCCLLPCYHSATCQPCSPEAQFTIPLRAYHPDSYYYF